MTLLSPKEEAAECRKAFEKQHRGILTRHWHPAIFCTLVDFHDEIDTRISNILHEDSLSDANKALRLRLFRPIIYSDSWPTKLKNDYAAVQKAYATFQTNTEDCGLFSVLYTLRQNFEDDYLALQHYVDCPACPHNGRSKKEA